MKRLPVNWTPAPGPVSKWFPVVDPRQGEPPIDCTVLSLDLVGVYGHFDGSRFLPCLGPRELDPPGSVPPCPTCEAGFRRRWRGYLGVALARNGRVVVLELTARAVQDCPPLIAWRNDLRGRRLRVQRLGRNRQGRVVAQLLGGDRLKPSDLPPPPDVEAALMRLWFGEKGP